jgi:branched-chain amino acid transport system permease protein
VPAVTRAPTSVAPTHAAWATRIGAVGFWSLPVIAWFAFDDRLLLGSQILIAMLLALSFDLVIGVAGILSLGHAAFFGIGAYAAGLLALHGLHDPLAGLVVSAAIAGVAGALSGFLVVRGADLTRLMLTLGLAMLLQEAANRLPFTGGADGLSGFEIGPVLGRFAFDLEGRVAYVWAFVVLVAGFVAARRLVRSPFGLALRGVRENTSRMHALGAPVERHLLGVWTFAATLAGAAGALLTQTTQFVGLDVLGFPRSADLLLMVAIGGLGRLYGAMLGAIVFLVAHEAFADADPRYWQFWLGALLVALVLVARGGLLGTADRALAARQRRRAAPAAASVTVDASTGAAAPGRGEGRRS